jgi:hypothetical protein
VNVVALNILAGSLGTAPNKVPAYAGTSGLEAVFASDRNTVSPLTFRLGTRGDSPCAEFGKVWKGWTAGVGTQEGTRTPQFPQKADPASRPEPQDEQKLRAVIWPPDVNIKVKKIKA